MTSQAEKAGATVFQSHNGLILIYEKIYSRPDLPKFQSHNGLILIMKMYNVLYSLR